jgi:hypothetical protein
LRDEILNYMHFFKRWIFMILKQFFRYQVEADKR